MRNNLINRKGFTLVEMIVVIAIIAILAAVIIPTTAGFIDRARLSNDRQQVTQMNRVLQTLSIEDDSIDLSLLHAQDVRDLLDSFSDESFVYATESRDTGFFYLPSQERVIVEKYDVISDPNYLLNNPAQGFRLFRTQGISASTNLEAINSPEELFGNGKVLISTHGDPVANIVYGVSLGLPHTQLEDFNDPGFLQSLFRNTRFQDLLTSLLDEFSPESTIYVSNTEWRFDETNPDPIRRILFTPGIRNIPTFEGYLTVTIDFEPNEIVLPSSVRTIERYAFIQFSDEVAISMPGNHRVITHHQAFRPGAPITLGNATVLGTLAWNTRLQTFSSTDITIEAKPDGISLDLSRIPMRSSIVAYDISVSGLKATVNIITNQGLVGRYQLTIPEYVE